MGLGWRGEPQRIVQGADTCLNEVDEKVGHHLMTSWTNLMVRFGCTGDGLGIPQINRFVSPEEQEEGIWTEIEKEASFDECVSSPVVWVNLREGPQRPNLYGGYGLNNVIIDTAESKP